MRRAVVLVAALLAVTAAGCGARAVRPEVEPSVAPTTPAPTSAGGETAADASRAIDLRDGELPNVCMGGAGVVRLRAGTASYESGLGAGFEGELEVQPIASVDLDGDGIVEHLALVRCAPGGSGTFDALWAFHTSGDRVVAFAHIAGGDRADGGLDGARVENGAVIVGRYSGSEEGVCCPTQITDEVWRLSGAAFTRVGVGEARPFHDR